MPELKFPKASVHRTFTLTTDLIDPPAVTLELTPADGKDKHRQLVAAVAQNFAPGTDVKELQPADVMRLVDGFDALIPIVLKHVIGWDLTIDGKAIPCTDEEKKKWLEPLLWEFVEPEKPAAGQLDPGDDEDADKEPALTWLWSAIMAVIGDRGNFSKN